MSKTSSRVFNLWIIDKIVHNSTLKCWAVTEEVVFILRLQDRIIKVKTFYRGIQVVLLLPLDERLQMKN